MGTVNVLFQIQFLLVESKFDCNFGENNRRNLSGAGRSRSMRDKCGVGWIEILQVETKPAPPVLHPALLLSLKTYP